MIQQSTARQNTPNIELDLTELCPWCHGFSGFSPLTDPGMAKIG